MRPSAAISTVAGYTFHLDEVENVHGPNYVADDAHDRGAAATAR